MDLRGRADTEEGLAETFLVLTGDKLQGNDIAKPPSHSVKFIFCRTQTCNHVLEIPTFNE